MRMIRFPIKKNLNPEDPKLSIIVHLAELRRRLIYVVGVFLLAFCISFYFSEELLGYFARPLTQLFTDQVGRRFIYTNLSEAFLTYMKVALFCACVLSCPFWALQIWYFMALAFYPQERRFYRVIFALIPLLFIAGSALAYYAVCPLAWRFFLSFESTQVLHIPLRFEAKIGDYLAITLKMMSVFGLGFQLPVVLAILVGLGVISLESLRKGRKYAFLMITIIAALMTPPDILSPLGLMVPLYALYEITLYWLSWVRTLGRS